jgi:hypothetical protein
LSLVRLTLGTVAVVVQEAPAQEQQVAVASSSFATRSKEGEHMAHAAKIENGVVTQVIVVPNDLDETESDSAITAYCNQIGLPGDWKRTSYNAADNGFRSKYAGVGDRYDAELDEFVSPEPVTE